jgi:probable F420-dependent oxidoreductase
MSLAIGAKLQNSGAPALRAGIPELARALEAAGFESLWVSDHIVLPAAIASRYPFAADGRATWSPETPYLDALVALALAAAVTERVVLGTAVLVLPLRNPVEFAKQAASIDVASDGRLSLGVGAGWLEEEFAALGVPFAGRGARLEEWVSIARACWTGRPGASASDRFTMPPDMLCLPAPAHAIPVLVGGHSRAALRRAGRIADGWLAQQSLPELAPDELAAAARLMRDAATESGRDPDALRIVLRIVEAAGRAGELARRLPALAAAGVDEIIVDAAWEAGDPADDYAVLRDGASGG